MVVYAQRLSNLSQTDLAPLLPLPVMAEPQDNEHEEGSPTMQVQHEPGVLQEVVALLRACDSVSLIPKVPELALYSRTDQLSHLQQAVLRLDPNAFLTGRAGIDGLPPGSGAVGSFTSAPQTKAEAVPVVIPDSEPQDLDRAVVRRKRQRPQPELEPPNIDEAEAFTQCLQSFLAKQQHGGHQDSENDTQVTETEDVNHEQPQNINLRDVKEVNVRLSKMTQMQQLHLYEQAQLLELLSALELLLQQGETVLIAYEQQDGEEQQNAVLLSLEACAACLQILSAPDMPKQVYKEELIDRIVGLVKYHLLNNVLVFYDAGICQANRPSLLDQGDEWAIVEAQGKVKKKAGKAKQTPNLSVPAATRAVQARLEGVLQLMGALLQFVQLQASTVLPLLRIACQSLTVEGIDLLQFKAAGFLVSVFQHSPHLQNQLLEDIVSKVLPSLPSGKRCHRAWVVGDSKTAVIQIITAMLVQMVQACVHLPADNDVKDEGADLRECFAPAIACCDNFWQGCFERLPAAKAAKSDADVDVKQIVEHIILDLLQVQGLPTWPAASTLLLRCMHTLGGSMGMQHNDASVRQISIDLVGVIAAHLHKGILSAEADQDWLAQMALPDGDKTPADLYMVSQHLLLDWLADHSQQRDAALAESARSFLVCRMFVDDLSSLQHSGMVSAKLQQGEVLLRYQKVQQQSDKGANCDLEADDANKIARAIVHQGPLRRGCQTLLVWLLDAADSTKQTQSSTQAKAIKGLGLVAEIDPSLLATSSLQICINKALQDDSVSVREAAVDLLGKHISCRQDLALAYFDILAARTWPDKEKGLSVRKRAINIMWESCVQQPGFQRANDACVHILGRVSDPEESIQKLVSKLFHSLWFPSGALHDGFDAPCRAQQLAEVALTAYEARPGIHLPLEPTHPLLTVIKQALAKESDSTAGHKLAAALLDGALQAVDTTEGPQETDSFSYLLALHAFCQVDVMLCMPGNNPARFARCLAPYLKVQPFSKDAPDALKRRAAERLLCILAVLTALLSYLDRFPEDLAQEVEADLVELINQHPFVQVVAAAAQTLCALAKLSASARQQLSDLQQKYMAYLQDTSTKLLKPDATPTQLQSNVAFACRFIYINGQLIRHGKGLLHMDTEAGAPDNTEIQQLLSLLMLFYKLKPGLVSTRDTLKLKEKALEGLGLLFIAHPAALMESAAGAAMRSALRITSPSCLKLKALGNLLELLKDGWPHSLVTAAVQSEEEGLQSKQEEAAAAAGAQDATKQEPAAGLVLPVQNGQGDSLNLSAGFIQANWEAIKALALDTSPAPPLGSSTPSHDPNQSAAQVRRRALEVIEAVLRGGVMPPFSAVPTLFALATDPTKGFGGKRDIADRAFKVVQREAERHSAVRSQLASLEGLQAAALFQEGLKEPLSPGQTPSIGMVEESAEGMAALYTQVLQPDRNIRMPFLRAVLRCFDTASDLLTRGAATADLRLLAFAAHMLAHLPYKRCDEPYTIVHAVNAITSRRGAFVLGAMKTALEAVPRKAPAQPAAQGNAQDETTPDADADEQQEAAPVQVQPQKVDKAGPEAACTASLALTMLLLLKEFLKETYCMSNERIAAFSPDIAEKRKQEERLPVAKQEGIKLRLHHLRIDARHNFDLRKEQYKVFKYYLQQDSADSGPVLMHSHSRKKAKVTCDEIADQAVLRGDADAGAIEERSASGHAPSTTNSGLAQQPTTGARSRGIKGQRSLSRKDSKDAKLKRASTQPRKKRKDGQQSGHVLQAVEYADSQDIDGDFEELYDDHNDDDFVAPSTKALARKMF